MIAFQHASALRTPSSFSRRSFNHISHIPHTTGGDSRTKFGPRLEGHMQRTNPKVPQPRVGERKVTKQLAGLVDGGFEEGQYEAALVSLDQIRSPEYSPLPAHIRQATCIALGVPTALRASVTAPRKQMGKGTDSRRTLFMPDDLPDTFETAPRYSPLPSRQAVDAARTLLFSFRATNSPASLLRAFPSYPLNPDPSAIRGRVEGADVDLDGEDSVIARVASLSVKSATSVWSMLKPGFVRWDIAVAEVEGKGKGTKRQPTNPKQESYEDGEDLSTPVSEGAWPVLEWLISLFERDAEMAEKEGKHIVLFCLSQQNKQHKGSGINLFTQLISLTSTTRFDLPMFVGALCGRIPIGDWVSLQTALEYLPDKQAYLHFKLLVCIQYLGHFSRPDGSVRAKRAAPRARGAGAEEKRLEESNVGDSVTRVYTIPNWKTTVGPLVSASHKGQKNVKICCEIKYELLVTYASLNNQQKPEGRDAGWDEELHDGSLQRTVEVVFSPTVVRDKEEAENVKLLGELLRDILFEA
ncbi:hypothetical protein BDM02DRAFT_2184490 [Thelephora ganbajun]|uniref:Uncharacterized protein n=1 Tax=Thelephora ganbajun TaxID=370292 RepID=A0ACB6ZV65_THEGA|nr:hypothetical protein BDM02DRAFT_2184490 [Thelephora ganbajun]